MNVQERIELSCSIAEYILEQVSDHYPYTTDENGDVVYYDWAQDVFNEHYAVVRELVEAVAGETK